MSILIGLMDQQIEESEMLGWETNKFGGSPIWINPESSPSIPECRNCGQILSLVSQLYCPLGSSSYHRCIYLFVCPGDCSKQEHGWRVFRSMKHDITQNIAASQQHPEHSDELWSDEQDDWGEGLCVSEVSYEAEPVKDPVRLTEACCAATDLECALVPQDTADDVSDSELFHSTKSLSQLRLSNDVTDFHDALTASGNSHVSARPATVAEAPLIYEDSGDAEMPVVMEGIGLADRERWSALAHLLNTKLEQDSVSATGKRTSSVVFKSYYISVINEPSEQSKDYEHVTDLIRSYERSEGKQLESLICDRPQISKRTGETSEVYEKTELKHGDKIFYKFMKRLQRCPQQCIRYERGGEPLLVSSFQEKSVSLCPYCGGERIFELQLLPSLIPYLTAKDGTPCEVEFGTVLIFTCKRNCWPADHDPACKIDLVEESIIFQQDPDIHLYR